MKIVAKPFYEEKSFDAGVWFRITPGGAWAKKASGLPVKLRSLRPRPQGTRTPIDCLLAASQAQLDLPTRKMLLDVLGVEGATISRIRSGHLRMTAALVLRVYDCTTFSIEEIRALAALPNPRFTPSDAEEPK